MYHFSCRLSRTHQTTRELIKLIDQHRTKYIPITQSEIFTFESFKILVYFLYWFGWFLVIFFFPKFGKRIPIHKYPSVPTKQLVGSRVNSKSCISIICRENSVKENEYNKNNSSISNAYDTNCFHKNLHRILHSCVKWFEFVQLI